MALLGLTVVAGCGGEAVEAKAAAAAQAKITAVRASTDSMRQERERRMAAAADVAPADSTARASLAATAVPGAAGAARPAASHDSLNQDTEAMLADSVQRAREIDVLRETFAYAGGTRDPFSSLISLDKSGPEIADLDLVGVYLDLRTPSNNVVVLREKASAKRHKMRVGDQLGRARLTQIRARDAVFVIQDFGFERQETLSLRKQEVETP
jgi:hypothetical protein